MSGLSGVFTVDVTSKKGSEAMDRSHRQIRAMRARLEAAAMTPRPDAEEWEIEEAREEGRIDARQYNAPRSAPYVGSIVLRAAYIAAWEDQVMRALPVYPAKFPKAERLGCAPFYIEMRIDEQ